MSSDPALDFFNKLSERVNAPEPEEDPQAFPGNTAPKNRGDSVDRPGFEWLNDLPSHEFLVKGEPRRFYTIGSLAQALHRKAVTIRSWESKGWLPQAAFRTPPPVRSTLEGKAAKGKRLYSREQVEFLVEAYGRFIEAPKIQDWNGFRQHIAKQYPKS